MNVGAFGEDGVEMRGEHEVGTRRGAGAHPDDIADFIYMNAFEPGLLEQAGKLLSSNIFVEWRGGDFADANLLFNEARLIAFGGFERGFYGRVFREPGRVLRERCGGDGDKDRGEC
jgi:hypothetical protein